MWTLSKRIGLAAGVAGLLGGACGGGQKTPAGPTAPGFSLVFESVGLGVATTPAANTSYPPGSVVNYAFSAKDGASNVYATIDGVPAALTGTVTMNQSHTVRAALDTEPGSRAPNFSGLTWDGATVRLSDYLGKVVLVDFSAITCEGSINQAPVLKQHYGTYHSRGLEILTVLEDCPALHDCPPGQLASSSSLHDWVLANALAFPVVSDPGNVTKIYNYSERFKTTDFPAVYIIDAAGVIKYRFRGFNDAGIRAALMTLFP